MIVVLVLLYLSKQTKYVGIILYSSKAFKFVVSIKQCSPSSVDVNAQLEAESCHFKLIVIVSCKKQMLEYMI